MASVEYRVSSLCERGAVELCGRFVHKISTYRSRKIIVVFANTVHGVLKLSVREKKFQQNTITTSKNLLLGGVSVVLYKA